VALNQFRNVHKEINRKNKNYGIFIDNTQVVIVVSISLEEVPNHATAHERSECELLISGSRK
jgi:hypothetical protein